MFFAFIKMLIGKSIQSFGMSVSLQLAGSFSKYSLIFFFFNSNPIASLLDIGQFLLCFGGKKKKNTEILVLLVDYWWQLFPDNGAHFLVQENCLRNLLTCRTECCPLTWWTEPGWAWGRCCTAQAENLGTCWPASLSCFSESLPGQLTCHQLQNWRRWPGEGGSRLLKAKAWTEEVTTNVSFLWTLCRVH